MAKDAELNCPLSKLLKAEVTLEVKNMAPRVAEFACATRRRCNNSAKGPRRPMWSNIHTALMRRTSSKSESS